MTEPDAAPPLGTPWAGPRGTRLDAALAALLGGAPEVEAAAVVSPDGLPMASALPASMDEDRVAAMSAALLSLGERAAEGLGRGALSQVYVEGEHGTVFLVAAGDEAVLVAVSARGAKTGLVLFEVRRTAAAVAGVLRDVPVLPVAAPAAPVPPPPVPAAAVVPAVVPVQAGPPRYGTAPDAVWSTPVAGATPLSGEPSGWS